MDKNKTVVRIGGKEYLMAGYESEEYMHKVAIYVDRKMNEVRSNFPNLSTAMIAVLSAANIADDHIKAQDEITELKDKLQLQKEEIRSLQKENFGKSAGNITSYSETKRNVKL